MGWFKEVDFPSYLRAVGETQGWFADLTGIPRATIGNLYRLENEPGVGMARLIIKASRMHPGPAGEVVGFNHLALRKTNGGG